MNWKRTFKNTAWVSAGQAAGRAVGFVYYIFLARNLSVEQFGIWNWVLGLGYNFYPLADFGIQRYVLKHLPREPDKKDEYLNKLLPLRLVLAFISIALSCFFALILGSKSKAWYMLIFILSLIPHNLIFLCTSINNALEKMHFYGLATLGVSLGYTLTGILMMEIGLALQWLFFSYFIGALLTLLTLKLFFREIGFDFNWIWDLPFYKKVISESWAFASLLVIGVFYLRISLVLIGVLLGDYQAGIYGSASKFVEAGILFPQSIAIAFFPSFSKLFAENKAKLKKTYLKAFPILLALATPFFFVMWFGGRFIILTIYGPDYLAAVPVFKLMGVLMLFFFINSLAGNVIQNSNKVVQFLPLRILSFLVAILTGILIIPQMGVIGGVWTLIVGEIFTLFINNWFVINLLKSK